jgi:hypothetical protein
MLFSLSLLLSNLNGQMYVKKHCKLDYSQYLIDCELLSSSQDFYMEDKKELAKISKLRLQYQIRLLSVHTMLFSH